MYTYKRDEDYNLILVSPSGQEKFLYGEDKEYFLEDVQTIEEYENESSVESRVSELIENYYWVD
jgi:hypothetical protein